ncbi:hypothetical protein QFZ52_000009 [Arthrobacter woluwensis]|nr:hypothetical protein [Arthrobacter woluwensis]
MPGPATDPGTSCSLAEPAQPLNASLYPNSRSNGVVPVTRTKPYRSRIGRE